MASGSAWTGDRIVAAIQAWAERMGQPPTANGWREEAAGRGPAGISRPTTRRVIRVFGSWNAAIVAARFIARRQGNQSRRRQRCAPS